MSALKNFLYSRGILEFPRFDQPLVSIVIVVHNRAELTLACLRGILGCSLPFEVIVVDNESKDLTARLFDQVRGVRYIRNTSNRHFVWGCNQGAKLAAGEFLLLLNSDTEVLPGAIEAAVDRIRSDSTIGVVGARLILPDGTLQEAGCFVWNSGVCEGYGRGGDPNAGPYVFSRPVDFCSGAFLLTPKALWDDLGGFDKVFEPAYYEEVDYCLRVWQAGRSVYYEPRTTVLHFEFGSSRSSQEAHSVMARNQQLFAERYRLRLLDRPPAGSGVPHSMRSPPELQARRVLVCDDHIPHMRTGAGYPRANRMLWALVQLEWQVSYFPLHPPGNRLLADVYEDLPGEIEIPTLNQPEEVTLERLLRERKGFYDAMIVSRPTSIERVRVILQAHPELFSGMHLIYDAEAIFAIRELQEKAQAGERISRDEAQKRIEREFGLIDGVHTVLTVSSQEAKLFEQNGMSSFVVGHAVSIRAPEIPWELRTDILFVGAIYGDRGPNFMAVRWFLDNVWPQLMKCLPQANFVVAGRNLSHQLTMCPLPERVSVTGELVSLNSVYDSARIFVAPTFVSAGIPLKVIEAAGNGVPVVATLRLAEQLQWGDALSVAGTAEAFMKKCLHLYNNHALWALQRMKALDRVAREYSMEVFQHQLRDALAHGIEGGGRSPSAGGVEGSTSGTNDRMVLRQ